MRGLAEPHGVVLDFGPLAAEKPLVLALTGWLRFGGGMANVAASHDPDLAVSLPAARSRDRRGGSVAAGGRRGRARLPARPRPSWSISPASCRPRRQRLRLTTAFEIHWDRIALFERRHDRRHPHHPHLSNPRPDLHWRGFSEFADLPWTQPLTPVYDRTFQKPHWTITPTGWCTRYGAGG